jgi:putative glycosyltransferase
MKLSIVATLYCSEPYVQEFHRRASAAARSLVGDDYEIILVNDGSPDRSLDSAIRLSETDERLTVIDLSRNFGHHKAMMTGLSHARGSLVYLIDSDLEEEPEWLIQFHSELVATSSDAVYGVQKYRKGGWFERLSGHFFYSALDMLSGTRIPKNAVTARLMTYRYVRALVLHKEREVFIAGLWQITGFKQSSVQITKLSKSATTYSLHHKVSLLVNSITSFSNLPLIAIFYFGIGVSALSLIYIGYLVVTWLFYVRPISGWTSVIASIWLIGGLIMSFIGVIGVYLAKMFVEVKQRPYTIVQDIYGRSRKQDI